MTHKLALFATAWFLILTSCESQEIAKEELKTNKEEKAAKAPNQRASHPYGGWYCPDNFGFKPVDIQELNKVPAVSNRLPTEEEVKNHHSLIHIDIQKYPDARALKMDLPRVAKIYSRELGMDLLIIVIQAAVINEDTIVGYRFPDGGNGSAWMSDVAFLSKEEVAALGSQPFYYSKSVLKATKEDLWRAIIKTPYAKELGLNFNQVGFFSSDYSINDQAHLSLNKEKEKAVGFVGMVYGNFYLQIDYNRNGFHYSEKILMLEDKENNTTELHVARGPFPEDFNQQKIKLDEWVESITNNKR